MLVDTILVATAHGPILPGDNRLVELAMSVIEVAILALALLLVVLAVKGTAWLVGYQLGRLRHPNQ
jgi:hypothetical protein